MASSPKRTSRLRSQYSSISYCAVSNGWMHTPSHDERFACEEDPTPSSLVRPRVRLLYKDEDQRSRYCANAQLLLDAALEADASSSNVKIARKALCYRKLISRLDDIDPTDPTFDISEFFGVQWRKVIP
ncbi:hypothetical protein PR003_g11525 [Phytophthora rubi]|uniref:Uncharacterized protein n=1 Tax=Phytophthora rubi TaxID=129364 RepID=A0A6A3JVX8_9STRA|nr:hypothetical protein PR001_g19461 [Phytophthora rubi]KAE9030884.1 hypothetical protein PR002_g9781 [Phytophthora rubi]KAE9338398.1 hypothetical protein PR003_g11525 [Phytophthora rubi]